MKGWREKDYSPQAAHLVRWTRCALMRTLQASLIGKISVRTTVGAPLMATWHRVNSNVGLVNSAA